MAQIEVQTFRFTFSNDFKEVLSRFAKVHQYDERKQFKEEWQKWIEDDEIRSMINDEMKTLSHNGFEGDALDKMFKSARYYFRKKSEEHKEKKERKKYTGFSRDILKIMDDHITTKMNNNTKTIQNINDEEIILCDISPEDCYTDFCEKNKDMILKEIMSLKEKTEVLDTKEVSNKFKKTYKNRYYMIRTK
jgi:hypothetical protein